MPQWGFCVVCIAVALAASAAAVAWLPGTAGAPPAELPAAMPAGCRAVPPGCGGCAAAGGWDAVLAEVADTTKQCTLIVYTTVFFGPNVTLPRPSTLPGVDRSSRCWLLFTTAAAAEGLRAKAQGTPWRVLAVPAPVSEGRRASRIPKLLGPHFFPGRVSVFVDFKLFLKAGSSRFAMQMLGPGGNVSLAAIRHPGVLGCPPTQVPKDAFSEAADVLRLGRTAVPRAVEAQVAAYRAEQAAKGTSFDVLIDAALVVWDGRTPGAMDFACEWYREYSTHSDRDQIAFAAVYGRLSASRRAAVRVLSRVGPDCRGVCHWYCRGSFARLRNRFRRR
eukprot:TRINITY_DN24675_c0_g1_i1.p1 TRINITY_DN24675_c0_g1~~TRINITY_DN24675_c0_g1_i1.p1  ORF type:complete len:333 (+),score=48.83 TRINITY_DN24675_c0_g1_i1:130-1128(+)